jgi:nucleosome binding factor SPN SPT16 subunit
LEFREPDLLLTRTNNTTLAAGMVFNLCIGFGDLIKGGKIGDKPGQVTESKESKKIKGFGKQYAVLMADTVVITPGGAMPEVLTNLNRSYDKVSYELDDNNDKPSDVDTGADEDRKLTIF